MKSVVDCSIKRYLADEVCALRPDLRLCVVRNNDDMTTLLAAIVLLVALTYMAGAYGQGLVVTIPFFAILFYYTVHKFLNRREVQVISECTEQSIRSMVGQISGFN